MNTWYSQLTRPPLTPPNWLFGPVWSVLYLMLAVSIMLYVYKSASTRPYAVYTLILIHLILNFIWTPLFFKLQSPAWALVDILLLDVTLLALLVIFRHTSRLASFLLWPYCAWVLFATYLNIGFFLLNRP